MGMWAAYHEASIPFTEPDRGLPPDVLDDVRLFFQA
jgi:hypothetical protein